MESHNYIEETGLKGVLIIKRPVFNDDRGFFREVFRKNDLEEKLGDKLEFVQANHSRSTLHTLRGIHVAPWYKLITVPAGKVQQVVVDLREDSETFGKYVSLALGEENPFAILVPPGCGNSYLVLSGQADYFYMVSDYWAGGMEKDVLYSDAFLNIPWESKTVMLSEKDAQAKTLREQFPQKF